jgi:autotransporter-associated beta strand protein
MKTMRILGLGLALAAMAPMADAVEWDGSSSTAWAAGDNWVGGIAPAGGDAILFDTNSLANLGTVLGGDYAISGLTVWRPAGDVLIGSNTLTIGAGGIDLSQSIRNLTIGSAVTLSAAQGWTVTNGRTLTVSGAVDNGGFLLSVTGGGAVALSGVLSGSGGLTYRGPGTMTLGGNNASFSGPVTVVGTTVNGATLVANATNALGSGAISVSGTARVQVNNAGYLPAAGSVTLTSGGTLLANYANAGQTELATIAGAGSTYGFLVLGGATTSNLDFSAHAGVSLGASGNFTYGGVITPEGSTYRLGGGSVAYFFSGNTGLTVTNLTGANDVVVSGTGLVTFAASNDYTGNTTISNRGVVRVDGNRFGTIPGTPVANNLTLDDGVIRFGPATWGFHENQGITLGAGGGEFHPWSTANITFSNSLSGPGGWWRTDSGTTTFAASNSFAGAISNLSGGTVNFNADGALGLGSGMLQAAGTMNVNAQNPAYAGAIAIQGSTIILNASNAIGTATTEIRSGGLLQVQNPDYLPATGSVTPLNNGRFLVNYANAGQAEVDTMSAAASGALVLGGSTSSNLDFTGKGGAFLGASGNFAHTGTLTPDGTTYMLGGGNVSPANNGNTGLMLANLTGARDVVIGQPGAVMLQTGNDFSGKITVTNGGWLVITNDTFTTAPGAPVNDYLTLDGGNLRLQADMTLGANRGVVVGTNGTQINMWGGRTTTIAGPVSGSGAIQKTDGGTLRLTADNPFAGSWQMNGGLVWIGSNSNLGVAGVPISMSGGGLRTDASFTLSSPVTLAGNGTFNTDAGTVLTVTSALAGAGSLIKDGTGTLKVGAAGVLPSGGGRGNITLNAGALDLNGFDTPVNGLTGVTGALVTNSAGGIVTLTVGNNNQGGVFAGQIASGVAVTKTGTGNWNVIADQPSTNQTTLSQGTLTLGAELAGAVHVNAGATLAISLNGLPGEYYNQAPNAANFVSLAALNAHMDPLAPALTANSSLAGAGFDFGQTGTGFPAPYNAGAANFETRWAGKYYAPTNGTYTFGTASDDGSMIFINGAVVVSNNYFQGVTYRSGTVDLTAGYHDITIAFYQGSGGYGMRASNTIPGQASTVLQNSYLYTPVTATIGGLGGISNSTVALGLFNNLVVDQEGATLFDGRLTGGTDTKLTKSGVGTLSLGQSNPGFTGTIEVTQGTLALRNLDAAGPGTITMNGGTLAFDTTGLLEGMVTNNGNVNLTEASPGTNVVLGAYMAQKTGGWINNTTYVYDGRIVNSSPTNVTWSFAENIDDYVRLKIDGVNVLDNGTWNAPTIGTVTLTPGEHLFEARIGQGGGGAGPVNSLWWTTTLMGFGIDVQGRGESNIANYVAPNDPGDGSFFVHDFRITNAVVLQATTPLDSPSPHGVGTLAGAVSGAGGLVKTGPGVAVLGGVSTYGGPTTVSNGILRAGSATAFPTTTDITVVNGAALDIAAQMPDANSLTLLADARFTGIGGSLGLGSAGTALAMQGGVTGATAGVRLTSGAGGDVVVSGGAGASTLGGVDLGAANRTFSVDDVNAGGEDLRVTAPITGTGGLLKTGAGTMTLAGMNTYGGATVIDGGTVRLDAPQAPAGAAAWYDAADAATVMTDGTAVTNWSDKSGNGRDGVQTTAANQPVYTTSGLLDGKPVIHFDGANDHFVADFSFLDQSQYSLFVVEARQDGGNRYFLGTSVGTVNNTRLHVGYRDTDTYTLAQYGNDVNWDIPGGAYTGQVWHMWGNTLDDTGHHIYYNGSNVANSASTVPLTNPSTTSGHIGMGITAQYFYGDLAEILMYDDGLSDADRRAVEDYLNFKWFGTGSILPTATDLRIAGGATLDLNGADQVVASLADSGGTGGLVTNSASTATTFTLNPGSGSAVFSGRIADGGAGNAIALVKSGAGTQVLAGDNAFSGGTTISAGTLQLGGGGAAGSVLGPIANDGALVFNRAGSFTNAGAISGGGSVVMAGPGTLVIPVGTTNTYGGPTAVSNGALVVHGAHTGSGLITVHNGATLGGGGSVAASVSVASGGTLSPGASTGVLTVEGDLTMDSGSTFAVELNGLVPGTGYDQVWMDGGVLSLNNPTLTLSVVLGHDPQVDDVYTILAGFGSLAGAGQFAGLPDATVFSADGESFRIDYNVNDVTLTVVPEPASLGLFAAAAAIALLRRRLGRAR